MYKLVTRNETKPLDSYKVQDEEGETFIAEALFEGDGPSGRQATSLIESIRGVIDEERPSLNHGRYLRYLDLTTIEGKYFLVRDQVELEPISNYLGRKDPALHKTTDWICTMLEIFGAAGEVGLQWNKIYPQSIWIDEEEKLYIIDPDVTKFISSYRSSMGLSLPPGELEAPEGEQGDATKKGLYSIGVLFYYLLTGTPPFKGDSKDEVITKKETFPPAKPHLLKGRITTPLSSYTMGLMAKKPDKRPPGFSKALGKLKEIKALESSSPQRSPARNRLRAFRLKLFYLLRGTRLFFRDYRRIAIYLTILVGGLIALSLLLSPQPTITQSTSPRAVVEYFYQSLDTADPVLMEEAASADKLGQLQRLILNLHVIKKANKYRQLHTINPERLLRDRVEASSLEERGDEKSQESSPLEETITGENGFLSIVNLKLTQLRTSPKPLFKTTYRFISNIPRLKVKLQMEDWLTLTKVKGKWKITHFNGDIVSKDLFRVNPRKD